MSDKYPKPPVDPNLIVASGNIPDRPMNPMERAIAGHFKADPRTDEKAKAALADLYPDTPKGVTPQGDIIFDPEVDAVAKATISGFDELGASDAMQWAREHELRELGDPRLGEGGQFSESPIATVDFGHSATHDEAARQAAALFAEDEDDGLTPVGHLDLQFTESVHASAPQEEAGPTAATKEPPKKEDAEDTWPQELPRAIKDMPDFVKVLDFYNLSEEQAMQMILAQEKPLSQEGRKLIWEKEIEMAGLTEADINAAIHQFLSKGYVERDFSFYEGKVKFTLRSRRPEHDRIVDTHLTRLMQANDGVVLPALENKVTYLWKCAGSLIHFHGFGADWQAGMDAEKATKASAEFIDSLPSIGFQMLTQAVAKLDNTCYYAAQKMAVENFS